MVNHRFHSLEPTRAFHKLSRSRCQTRKGDHLPITRCLPGLNCPKVTAMGGLLKPCLLMDVQATLARNFLGLER